MPIQRQYRPNTLWVCCFIGLWLGTATASAGTATATEGKKLPSKVTFIDAPSSESPKAREKRLKRECKGRPNAGMCLGHTR